MFRHYRMVTMGLMMAGAIAACGGESSDADADSEDLTASHKLPTKLRRPSVNAPPFTDYLATVKTFVDSKNLCPDSSPQASGLKLPTSYWNTQSLGLYGAGFRM